MAKQFLDLESTVVGKGKGGEEDSVDDMSSTDSGAGEPAAHTVDPTSGNNSSSGSGSGGKADVGKVTGKVVKWPRIREVNPQSVVLDLTNVDKVKIPKYSPARKIASDEELNQQIEDATKKMEQRGTSSPT